MKGLQEILSRVKGFTGYDISSSQGMKLNSFTLRFIGSQAHFEEEFLGDYYQRTIKQFRFSMILALVFYNFFGFLDTALVTATDTNTESITYETYQALLIIRFAIATPILLLALGLSFTKPFKKYFQLAVSIAWFVTGFGIIVMNQLVSADGVYSYYAGLILIFVFGYTFIKARFLNAFILGSMLTIAYWISAGVLLETPKTTFIINNFFIIGTSIIGMFTNYSQESTYRLNFYMRKLVALEQEKVIAANESLEKRVVDRTTQLTKTNRELNKEIKRRLQYEEERNRLESQLFQMQKMETIGTLAGGIAHDFNNILTPILGYTEMALEELDEENSLRYDIEQIHNAALRAKDLVQQILTFSRQVDVDKKPIHLDKVIREVLSLVKASFPSNIEIILDLDPNCGTVMADTTQIHQVIMNLCTNAYHSMLEGGGTLKIELYVTRVNRDFVNKNPKLKIGNYICASITDTGHGMDKDTIGRIFEPFFTKKEVGQGSGLGLSVVHGIVNSFDGIITVDSKENKGSNFTIYLPQHSEGQGASEKIDGKVRKGTEHILFIDDEEEITFMGKRMLEGLGYSVSIHTKSLTALEDFMANPKKYNLVVSDQTMPNMLGTDLIDRFKKIQPDIKAIIITGFGDSITEEVAKDKGIDAIVIKPLILSKFSTLIRKILDKKVTKKTQ